MWKSILLVVLGSLFSSCKGQDSSSPAITMDEETAIPKSVWVIFQDTKGGYWFGSNGQGIYRYDGKRLTTVTIEDGLVDNTIRGMQEDKNGHIYIETPSGISMYDGKTYTTLQPIRSDSNEWKLAPEDLWFGYNAYDLYRYDGKSLFELQLPRQDLFAAFGIETTGVPFKGNNNTPYAVFGVDKDVDGNIWFGTATAGAFRYDGKDFLWFGEKELSSLPDGRVPGVRSMIQDKNGYFWLSNFVSKYKINSDLLSYKKIISVDILEAGLAEKLPYFMSAVADKDGNIWMSTYGGGVWKYDGKVLSNIDVKNEDGDVLLISIFQDKEGTLWLGTDNDGIYKGDGATFEKFEPN